MQSTSFELKNKVVRAGAGAGKTTNLTHSVLDIASDFYKAHERLPNMVVTTFTRKATEELRERITSELFKCDEAALFGLVQSKQHLQISTIHGVLSLFLRQYGSLVGLEAGFTVSDSDVSQRMAKRVLHDLVQNFSGSLELMDHYSFEQLLGVLLVRRRKLLESPVYKPYTTEELKKCVEAYVFPRIEGFSRVLKLIQEQSSSDKWVDYAGHFQNIISQLKKDFEFTKAQESIKAWGRKPSFSKKKAPHDETLHDEFEALKKEFDSMSKKTGLNPNSFQQYIRLSQLIDDLGKKFDEALKAEKVFIRPVRQ